MLHAALPIWLFQPLAAPHSKRRTACCFHCCNCAVHALCMCCASQQYYIATEQVQLCLQDIVN
jgi:hypothetical protein